MPSASCFQDDDLLVRVRAQYQKSGFYCAFEMLLCSIGYYILRNSLFIFSSNLEDYSLSLSFVKHENAIVLVGL